MTDGMGTTGGATRSGGEPEPTESLRTFGAIVKAFRKRALLTQEQFAPLVQYSVPTVASIEQGRRFPPLPFVERSEAALDAFGAIRAAAAQLSRRPGIASWFHQWAKLEAEAISLYTYECRLIPGLLQSEEYARTLFANRLPPLDDDQIEARLTARVDRQRLLYEKPNTSYSFIIEEHALLRGMGGTAVTREVLDHMLEVAELRNVEIQVMPLACKGHAGIDGPMRLCETPENQWLGYCEGQESGQLITDRKVVSMLQMRYARMRSQALSLGDSTGLLRQMRGAL
ncbi:Scr1 family TA system antitoxin-like transcriptional regulator [Streptomyces sp. NPDC059605]|uniref:helix-turn-helix domain-containing protein n=1 Tax=unclassified Streptomyces TaxID=2593676 RepID=UPI0036CAD031